MSADDTKLVERLRKQYIFYGYDTNRAPIEPPWQATMRDAANMIERQVTALEASEAKNAALAAELEAATEISAHRLAVLNGVLARVNETEVRAAALAAENATLREAAEKVARKHHDYSGGPVSATHSVITDAIDELRAALRQEAGRNG